MLGARWPLSSRLATSHAGTITSRRRASWRVTFKAHAHKKSSNKSTRVSAPSGRARLRARHRGRTRQGFCLAPPASAQASRSAPKRVPKRKMQIAIHALAAFRPHTVLYAGRLAMTSPSDATRAIMAADGDAANGAATKSTKQAHGRAGGLQSGVRWRSGWASRLKRAPNSPDTCARAEYVRGSDTGSVACFAFCLARSAPGTRSGKRCNREPRLAAYGRQVACAARCPRRQHAQTPVQGPARPVICLLRSACLLRTSGLSNTSVQTSVTQPSRLPARRVCMPGRPCHIDLHRGAAAGGAAVWPRRRPRCTGPHLPLLLRRSHDQPIQVRVRAEPPHARQGALLRTDKAPSPPHGALHQTAPPACGSRTALAARTLCPSCRQQRWRRTSQRFRARVPRRHGAKRRAGATAHLHVPCSSSHHAQLSVARWAAGRRSQNPLPLLLRCL